MKRKERRDSSNIETSLTRPHAILTTPSIRVPQGELHSKALPSHVQDVRVTRNVAAQRDTSETFTIYRGTTVGILEEK